MTVIEPVPGDPSTEPVATAQQSHVEGRVGPPTFAQDDTNEIFTPDGVKQIKPGQVAPAETPFVSGLVGDLVPEGASAPGEPVIGDQRKPASDKRTA